MHSKPVLSLVLGLDEPCKFLLLSQLLKTITLQATIAILKE